MRTLPLLVVSCDGKEEAKPATNAAPVERAKDYVCGMMIPKATAIKHTNEGADDYFCADACVEKFKSDPRKYGSHYASVGMKKACSWDLCGGKESCDCVK